MVSITQKKWHVMGVLGLLLLTGACSTPEEKVFNHLEEAVSLESSFKEQQEPLMELEKKEQELYEKMLSLDLEESGRIKELSEEAVGFADERQKLIDKEKESIEAAYEEYAKAEESLSEIDEASQESEAVQNAMNHRYESYQSLYESYSAAIEKDIQLYQSFLKKDLTLDQLQEYIDASNEKYAEVAKHRKSFNQYTEQYNQAKKKFYETAGFEVNTEDQDQTEEGNKD